MTSFRSGPITNDVVDVLLWVCWGTTYFSTLLALHRNVVQIKIKMFPRTGINVILICNVTLSYSPITRNVILMTL